MTAPIRQWIPLRVGDERTYGRARAPSKIGARSRRPLALGRVKLGPAEHSLISGGLL